MDSQNIISFHTKGVFKLRITLLFLGAFFLAGFTSDGSGADAKVDQEPASSELNLFDSIAFDSQLSNSLAAKLPAVTVKVIAPFTVNNIPERIDKWLSAVRKFGGKVELKPDPDYPASRNFGLIFSLLSAIFDLAKEKLFYSYSENYNVQVLYKQGSGEVTKFVFTLKEVVK